MSIAKTPWNIGLETDGESIQIISADGQDLATVRQYPLLVNAKLMMSAPELLHGCKLALDCIGKESRGDLTDKLAKVLRTTIKLAESGKE